ncbi:MAG: bifunctional demethylmenaquinone methyltransferase/2-methoxy-6-polyprenyl-1,4-benzoquinol methylase UbiE [Pyrinomonadaceae bacterium]
MSFNTKHQLDGTQTEHARRVREMFGGIARRYDLLNHVLSGNTDKRWRRLVAKRIAATLPPTGGLVLDVACGTGDLSLAIQRESGARVIGTDFCRPMLEIAARKAHDIPLVEGDALRLPFADQVFDAVSIAFGLRNLSSVEDGLTELRRVLKPGGHAAVLEFSTPVVPGMSGLFQLYFHRVLPRIGGMVSGSRAAYTYLPNSVVKFPDQGKLAEMMTTAGFTAVEYKNLTGGIAALHFGRRGTAD